MLLVRIFGMKTDGLEKLDSVSSSIKNAGGLLLRLRRYLRPIRMKNKMINKQPMNEQIPTRTDCGVLSPLGD